VVHEIGMTARRDGVPDWSYRDARQRLIAAGQALLPRHSATGRLDERANRLVDCTCGWSGNGLGWSEHLDHVVRSGLRG
jgi:hypothetical protein